MTHTTPTRPIRHRRLKPIQRALIWAGISSLLLIPLTLRLAQRRLDEARYENEVALLISERRNETGRWLTNEEEVKKGLLGKAKKYGGYAHIVRIHERSQPSYLVIHEDASSLTLRIRFQWFLGGTTQFSLRAER